MILAATTVTQSTSSLVVIALIAGLCTVLAASIPIYVNGKMNRKQKEEEWARQDAVAQRAVEAVAAAEKVAEDAAKVAAAQAESAERLDAKLTQIAHQTDGLYTAALESELRALLGQAATLREVVALRVTAGTEVDIAKSKAVIEAADQRIMELERGLELRRKYQDAILARPLSDLELGPLQVEVVNAEPVDVALVDKPQETAD